MQLKKVRRRTTSSEALLHQKMEGTGSGVEAAETEAGPLTQQGSTSKSKKTRAAKDKHNESCRRSRSKKKREVKELKEKTDELEKELKRVKAEKQEKETEMELELKELERELKLVKAEKQEKESKLIQYKSELIQYKSKLRGLENIKQQRYDTNQALRARLEGMRQIPKEWKDNLQGQNFTSFEQGQNFTSVEEMEEWCLSQTYVQDCHVSETSGTVVPQDIVNGFVGLGAIGTGNFPPSMADLSQQMGFDQLFDGTNINLGVSTCAGPSSVEINHDFPFGFDASNSHGVWINSTAVQHNLPELTAKNSVDSHFNDDLGAGILTNYAAAPSSFGAYSNLENDGDLYTHGAAPGILANYEAGPSSVANYDFPSGFDASNTHGVWTNSTAVKDNFSDLAVSNNVDNFSTDDFGAGILPKSEAGPSSGAYI